MSAEEAVLGELVHDRGSGPDEAWFIVGANGYFDVDNACWCEPQEDDTPWTSEWFDLFGTLPDLIRDRVYPTAQPGGAK